MEQKRIVATKISIRRQSYSLRKDDVLIRVTQGHVVDVIRGIGEYPLTHKGGESWYCVDERLMSYPLFYQGGEIQFTFSWIACAAFPTRTIQAKDVVGKDMAVTIQEWATNSDISAKITDYLTGNHIKTEQQLFEGDHREQLEKMLKSAYQEQFIKAWGMLIDAVSITRKVAAESKSIDDFNLYNYIL